MAITKSNGATAESPVDNTQTAPPPVSRVLNTTPPETNSAPKGRDYDAEARGKVACVAYNAALASPGLAMFNYANLDEYLVAVRKVADASVAYTWEKQKS